MAIPMIAAGIAARAIAKKIATRAAGGITGAGAKTVSPINREMGTGSVKKVPSVSLSQNRAAQYNKYQGERLQQIKSGARAQDKSNLATSIEKDFLRTGARIKSKTVKINSGNMRAR
jgi:hypothetical protein